MICSKRSPNLIESDRGKEFYNNIFQDSTSNSILEIVHMVLFLQNASIKSIRDLLKRPVFENGDGNWIDILSTITKRYNNRIHSSTKLSPKDASLKKNEGFVYKNLLDKRKKIKPKFQMNDLVSVADLKKMYSKGDTTNWSYKLYKITEIVNDTMPSYKINNLPERYNESLLKKADLKLKEYDNVMKKLNLS